MALQAATGTGGSKSGWAWDGLATLFAGRLSNGTMQDPAHLMQTFTFPSARARYWRWIVLDCHWDQRTNRSHAMVEELEFHATGSNPSVYMLNSGTATKSLVDSSSGDGTAKNPDWQAVDGLIRYKSFLYGYDAVLKPLPYPVLAPATTTGWRRADGTVENVQPTNITWKWDGINGNNGVWLGSTKGKFKVL